MDLKAERREIIYQKINNAYRKSDGETLDKICSQFGITHRTYMNYRKEFEDHIPVRKDIQKKHIGGHSRPIEYSEIELVGSKKKSHKPHRSERTESRAGSKYDNEFKKNVRKNLEEMRNNNII